MGAMRLVIVFCARDIRRNVEAVLLDCIVPGFYGLRRRPTSSLRVVEAILATPTEIRM